MGRQKETDIVLPPTYRNRLVQLRDRRFSWNTTYADLSLRAALCHSATPPYEIKT